MVEPPGFSPPVLQSGSIFASRYRVVAPLVEGKTRSIYHVADTALSVHFHRLRRHADEPPEPRPPPHAPQAASGVSVGLIEAAIVAARLEEARLEEARLDVARLDVARCEGRAGGGEAEKERAEAEARARVEEELARRAQRRVRQGSGRRRRDRRSETAGRVTTSLEGGSIADAAGDRDGGNRASARIVRAERSRTVMFGASRATVRHQRSPNVTFNASRLGPARRTQLLRRS